MFRPNGATVTLLVTGIVVSTPSARSDEQAESGRDVVSASVASQAGDSRSASEGDASPCSHPALRSHLLAMVKEDQAVRGQINSKGETPELLEEESRIDWRNTAGMKSILDEFGWPTQNMVGKNGARAAWLLAMHADHDTKFQRRCLALMKAALKRGAASALHMAYLTDRVRTREGKPQVYGTQNGVIDGVRLYFPIEDLKQVEKRRAEVGLPPLGEYRELPSSLVITMGKPRPAPAQQGGQSEREAMYYRYLEFPSFVKGGSITPHWMADGSSFWYAEGAPETTVIYEVDPKANAKTPMFDAARLRQTLKVLVGHELPYQGLPFDKFTFVDEGETAVSFNVKDTEFILQLDTYTINSAPTLSEQEKVRLVPQIVRKRLAAPPVKEVLSPDRRWFAGIKDHNLWLRSTDDGRSMPITTDGIDDYEWEVDGAVWSPDSLKLAVRKVDYRTVAKLAIVHWLKPTAEVEWVQSDAGRPGPMSQPKLFVVDILSKRQVLLDTGNNPDQHFYILGWRPDGSELLFLRKSRDHKKLDLLAANHATGATRVILTETQKTFVIDWSFLWFKWLRRFTWLEDGQRFLWLSERDGWKHLYLYDLEGNLIRRLTQGDFPVVRIEAVDEKSGWVYFTAHGERQRPYDTHLYRVNLNGKSISQLTEASGQHHIRFAPLKEFFLDTHSAADRPPTVQLRQADGTLLQTLAKANIDALKALKWSPPEEFVVKAADGKTDLYGVLYTPHDFNPQKKYPVIEVIYAGPQLSEVPHSFIHPDGVTFHAEHGQALAQLGFIAFVVDGRGTPGRGKEFQDVAYGNIGRHEIPDHVAALKQLAENRPYMDLSRVGIFGWSFGGYFSVRALLLAPDVYHVGIAIAPVADLYLGNGIEAYMDLPKNNEEAYEYASNLRLAENLKGKLLLIHGTGDGNSPFSQTMKIVEALIRAGKPYDLLVLPEETHYFSDAGTKYIREAIRRYFHEHLKP